MHQELREEILSLVEAEVNVQGHTVAEGLSGIYTQVRLLLRRLESFPTLGRNKWLIVSSTFQAELDGGPLGSMIKPYSLFSSSAWVPTHRPQHNVGHKPAKSLSFKIIYCASFVGMILTQRTKVPLVEFLA